MRAVTVAFGLLFLAVSAPPALAARCPQPERTKQETVEVVRGERAALYSVIEHDENGTDYGHSFACNRRTGRVHPLDDDVPMDRAATAFAGPYAAFIFHRPEPIINCTGVALVDIRTGDQRDVTNECNTGSADQDQEFFRIALLSTGTVAWTVPQGVFAAQRPPASGGLPAQRRLGGPTGLRKLTLRAGRRSFCWRVFDRERCSRADSATA
jgi:hypothetical protein